LAGSRAGTPADPRDAGYPLEGAFLAGPFLDVPFRAALSRAVLSGAVLSRAGPLRAGSCPPEAPGAPLARDGTERE